MQPPRFVLALLIFVLLNASIAWVDVVHPFTNFRKSSIADRLRLLNLKYFSKPAIVLLGSSVLNAPVTRWAGNQFGDEELSAALQKRGCDEEVAILGADGLQPTDYYALLHWYENHVGKPKELVFAVWLGSFIPKGYELQTHAIRTSMNPGDYITAPDYFASEPWTRLSLALSSAFPLYGSRSSIQSMLASKLHLQSPAVEPDVAALYRQERSGLTISKLRRHLDILSFLLRDARAKSIPCIVINMPVRSDSLDIAPSIYAPYLESIQQICSKENARFVDLQARKSYPDSGFGDPHHLTTASGALMFVNDLIDIVCPKK